MALNIVYTTEAKETLQLIYDRIHTKFGEKSAKEFASKSANIIALVSVQPFMYKALAIDEYVRVGFVTKQCSLIYRVTDTEIHLLYFWDNRQDPLFTY